MGRQIEHVRWARTAWGEGGVRRERWVAALAALVALVCAPAAAAGTYDVWSCRGPAGEPAGTGAWTAASAGTVAGDVVVADDCASGGPLSVGLAEGRSFTGGAAGRLRFAAPDATRIAAFTLWRSLDVVPWAPPATYRYEAGIEEQDADDLTTFDGCRSFGSSCTTAGDPNAPLAQGNAVVQHAAPLQAVALRVGCEMASHCDAVPGVPAIARLHRARVSLDDLQAPQVHGLSGTMTGAQPVGGVATLSVSAGDDGGGIAEVRLAIDGVQREVARPGGSCASPYVIAVPCPAELQPTFAIPAGGLPEGTHTASGEVVDAGGNTTGFGPVTFVIGPAPAGPAAVVAAAGAAANGRPAVEVPRLRLARTLVLHRRGTRATVGGVLTTPTGEPVAGAVLGVTAQALGVDGAPVRSRPDARTDARGRFSLTVPGDGAQRVVVSFAPQRDGATTASVAAVVRTPLALGIARSRSRLSNGETVVLRGALRGGGGSQRGAVVEIQAIVGGRWRPVGIVRADRQGHYRWRYRFVRVRTETRFRFRAVVRDSPGWPWPQQASRAVRVTVTSS